jgi:hypothetical protein
MTVIASVAEFQTGHHGRLELWSLTTFEKQAGYVVRNYYNVDWSRALRCHLFDCSGFGGDDTVEVEGAYFARGPVTVVERSTGSPRRLKRLPRRYQYGRGSNLLEWLQENGIEEDSVWCSLCGDHFPKDQTCEHIWWCHEIGWYSTPGERCGCATRAMCDGGFQRDPEGFAFDPAHPPLREDGWPW